MKCEYCEHDCEVYVLDCKAIHYCVNCWGFICGVPNCEKHNPTFVRWADVSNRLHLKMQCTNCGDLESKTYKKTIVKDFNQLPLFNKELYDKKQKIDWDKYREVFFRYNKKSYQNKKKVELESFLKEHSEYLLTSQWKEKRLLVLNRDNYICQSCLIKKATEVHHKSYKYWKNEPLFDLISVCNECHNDITNMNRVNLIS